MRRVELVKVRRLGQILPVLVFALGMVTWQAGIGLAQESEPTVGNTTTTTTSDPGVPAASEAPVSAAALTGPVGYTNGATTGGGLCDFFEIDLPTGHPHPEDRRPRTVRRRVHLLAEWDALRLPAAAERRALGASQLITVDLATGTQTVVGNLPPVGEGGMTFDAGGNLWLYAGDGDAECQFNFCLYKVDPATAASTLVGGEDDRFIGGLAATCTEVQVASTPDVRGDASVATLDRLNTTNAVLTQIVTIPDIGIPTGLDYDAASQLWGVGSGPVAGFSNPIAFRVDTSTGADDHRGHHARRQSRSAASSLGSQWRASPASRCSRRSRADPGSHQAPTRRGARRTCGGLGRARIDRNRARGDGTRRGSPASTSRRDREALRRPAA